MFSIATKTIWSKYFPPEATPRACGNEMVRARSRTIDSARPKVVFVCSSTLDYCQGYGALGYRAHEVNRKRLIVFTLRLTEPLTV